MAESSPVVSITDSVIPSLVSMLTSADFFFSVVSVRIITVALNGRTIGVVQYNVQYKYRLDDSVQYSTCTV